MLRSRVRLARGLALQTTRLRSAAARIQSPVAARPVQRTAVRHNSDHGGERKASADDETPHGWVAVLGGAAVFLTGVGATLWLKDRRPWETETETNLRLVKQRLQSKFEYLAKPSDPDTTVGSVFHSHPVEWEDDELGKSVRYDWPSFLLIEGPSDTGKSYLVAKTLEQWSQEQKAAVVWVSLRGASSPGALTTRLRSAIGLPHPGPGKQEMDLSIVLWYLDQAREELGHPPLRLVVDNIDEAFSPKASMDLQRECAGLFGWAVTRQKRYNDPVSLISIAEDSCWFDLRKFSGLSDSLHLKHLAPLKADSLLRSLQQATLRSKTVDGAQVREPVSEEEARLLVAELGGTLRHISGALHAVRHGASSLADAVARQQEVAGRRLRRALLGYFDGDSSGLPAPAVTQAVLFDIVEALVASEEAAQQQAAAGASAADGKTSAAPKLLTAPAGSVQFWRLESPAYTQQDLDEVVLRTAVQRSGPLSLFEYQCERGMVNTLRFRDVAQARAVARMLKEDPDVRNARQKLKSSTAAAASPRVSAPAV